MKLFTGALLLMVLFFTGSCTKTVTNQVNAGQSIFFTIHPQEWEATTNTDFGKGFSISLSIPEITSDIMQQGAVLTYISLDGENTFEPIPEVINGVTYITSHSAGVLDVGVFDAYSAGVDHAFDGDVVLKVVLLNTTRIQ